MTEPCSQTTAIDFLVDNAKRHDAKLDKLIELHAENITIKDTLKNHGDKLEKIDSRLEKVEVRPAKMLKWALGVITPVISAVLIYWMIP